MNEHNSRYRKQNNVYHIDTEFWIVLEAICMFDKAESSESLSCQPVR